MNTVTRHPSAPRRTPPPPARPAPTLPMPVWVCGSCKDPVVRNVRPGPSWIVALALFFMAVIPAILYLIWFELQKRTAVTCPQCNGVDLVPIDSTRGREILGDRYDESVRIGRRLAVEAQRAAELAAASTHRAVVVALSIVLGLVVVGALALVNHQRQEAKAEGIRRAEAADMEAATAARWKEREATETAARDEEFRRTFGLGGDSPSGNAARSVTIASSGVALERPEPGASPTWKITAGEKYRIAEERDGWIRLRADVPAWVESSNITR